MTEIKPSNSNDVVYVAQAGHPYHQDDEIDLIELWLILWRKKWLVIGITTFATIAAILVSLFVLEPTYKATAKIMPIQSEEVSNKEIVASYLTSSKFKRQLITNNNLLQHLYSDQWNDQKNSWNNPQDAPTVVSLLTTSQFPLQVKTEDKFISISWEDSDPEFAANILETALQDTKQFLNSYQFPVESFIQSTQKQISELRQLKQETPQNEAINTELANLVPKLSNLQAQAELHKKFTVINEPLPPEQPESPNKKLIVALTFVTSLFFAVFLAFVLQFITTARQRIREGYYEKE